MSIWKNTDDAFVDGFDFSKSDFEDLIDNYTPFEDIPPLLGVSITQLDNFCRQLYNQNYKPTYAVLLSRANAFNRKAFNNLAKNGNQTAIKIVADNFMKLNTGDTTEHRVTFVNSIPDVPSDVDNLKEDD